MGLIHEAQVELFLVGETAIGGEIGRATPLAPRRMDLHPCQTESLQIVGQ